MNQRFTKTLEIRLTGYPMTVTAAEQYLIELINRARLDPQGEADRFLGGNINQNNTGVQFDTAPRQPLAGNDAMHAAAAAHSVHMINVDLFAHEGIGDGTPRQRIEAQGFAIAPPSSVAENISARGSTGPVVLADYIESHHEGLFKSIGHRRNILNGEHHELGVGQEAGLFSGFPNDPTAYNASLLTEKFMYAGNRFFITGVVYNDTVNDDFYTMGEGVGGRSVWVSGVGSTTSAAAGGYEINVEGQSGTKTVTSGSTSVQVTLANQNIKLDFVGSSEVHASDDVTVLSGVSVVRLLGSGDIDATGASANEILAGTSGNNKLVGNGGNDILRGLAGNDILNGGTGLDTMNGGTGHDTYFVDHAFDAVVETGGFSGGRDTIITTMTYTLPDSVERLNLTGTSANVNATGNGMNNVIATGSGHNIVNGGAGSDLMMGGSGNDTYLVDNLFDFAQEFANGGTDTVRSAVDYRLKPHIENLLLTGTGNTRGIGNNENNAITGNSGNNSINGWNGSDILTGGAGNDFFGFNTVLGPTNVDTITDFSVADDTIVLQTNAFPRLTPSGALAASQLHVGSVASRGADDLIIYDPTTGALHYDTNGPNPNGTVQFATIGTGLAITGADFLVI